MTMFWAICSLIAGCVLLWKSADVLVAGAVSIAHHFGLSPFIIGLTIVAMGTSAPEAAASIRAVFSAGGGDLAIGNVLGSNVANLALVGGTITLIRPMKIQRMTIAREIPAMVIAGLILGGILWDGQVTRVESIILLGLFTGFLLYTIYIGRMNPVASFPTEEDHNRSPVSSMTTDMVKILGGLIGLALGADLVIKGASTLGKAVGLSDAVIGLTIVSVGTSLPELITCVVAALKGHDDISVGNLVGSNIFNTLLVTGAAGICCPFIVGTQFAGGIDFWVMIGVSLVFVVLACLGRGHVKRMSGLILLTVYVLYITYLLITGQAVA